MTPPTTLPDRRRPALAQRESAPLRSGFARRARVAVVAGMAAACLGTAASAAPPPRQNPWSLCDRAIPQQERAHGIPERLLTAISLAESGRWNAEAERTTSWPWTVMAENRGRFLNSKEEAIDEVLRLRRRGVRNIDVGCMQINLQYHPQAFESLDEAFDPEKNTAYAAQFLKTLKEQSGSWTTAVGHYHSQAPERTYPYRRKVLQIWRDTERRGPSEAMVAMTTPGSGAVPPPAPAAQSPADRRRPLSQAEVNALRRDRLHQARATADSRRDRVIRAFEERRRLHDAFIERQARMIDAYRRYMHEQGRSKAQEQ
ncbi:MAG: transglycosylase SLT domain-containing protein [Alphaproteobacteria bacterium]|nr:transglycosylase SLT domain-containing protein [Alphaproteobacteria bacterium]